MPTPDSHADDFHADDFHGKETVLSPAQLVLDMEYAPRINFAFQQNGIPFLRRFGLRHCGSLPLGRLCCKVSIEPPVADPLTFDIPGLSPGAEILVENQDLVLRYDLLRQWTEKVRGQICVEVSTAAGGDAPAREILRQRHPVEIHAWNEWTGLQSLPEILAAFVTPNSGAVGKILSEASDLLSSRGGTSALNAYQSGNPSRVYEVLAAIFDAVRARDIRYSPPPASFEQSGQRVRFPETILQSGFGTCLDLSLLFASLLEQAGLHPLLLLHQGHCYAGCWLHNDSFPEAAVDDLQSIRKRVELDELVVFESTVCTRDHASSLAEAERLAFEHLQLDEVFHFAVDIFRSRASGIRPLPLKQDGEGIDPDSARQILPARIPSESALRPVRDTPAADSPQETPQTRLDRWKQQLLDLTLRNRLLNFRETNQTVPLVCHDLAALEDAIAANQEFKIAEQSKLMAGQDPRDLHILLRQSGDDALRTHLEEELRARRLRAPLGESDLGRRLLEIFRRTRLELDESGANTLYLALGFLEWKESPQANRSHLAPILLIPVNLKRKSVVEGFSLVREDTDAMINVTLLEMLKRDFGKEIPGLDPPPEDESGIDVPRVLLLFAHAVKTIPGWELRHEAWLGRFSFNKFLLWKDLRDRVEALTRNPVVEHLVHRAGQPFLDETPATAPDQLDETVSPHELFCPLSADSSQLAAVVASARGKNFVLYGPPGTGKSQTIANLITHNLALGRKVLFVAEKRAALEVVHHRLSQLGMAEFCLELHSNKTGKADVLRQLGEALDLGAQATPSEWEHKTRQLAELRRQLNDFVRELHQSGPGGFSAYDGYACLIRHRLANGPATIRFTFKDMATHGQNDFEHLKNIVSQLPLRLQLVPETARRALRPVAAAAWTPDLEDEAVRLAEALVPAVQRLRTERNRILQALNLRITPSTLDEIHHFLQLCARLLKGHCTPSAFLLTPGWNSFHKEALQTWLPAGRSVRDARETLARFDLDTLRSLDIPSLESKYRSLSQKGGWLSAIRIRFLMKPVAKAIRPGGEKWSPEQSGAFLKTWHQLVDAEQTVLAADARAKERLGDVWRGLQTSWDDLEELLEFGESLHREIADLSGGDPRKISHIKEAIAPLLAEADSLLAPNAVLNTDIRDLIRAWEPFLELRDALARLLDLDETHVLTGGDALQDFETFAGYIQSLRHALHAWCAWRKIRSEACAAELGPVIDLLENKTHTSLELAQIFETSYREAALRHRLNESSVLRDFWGEESELRLDRFHQLDETYMRLSAAIARARVAANMPGARGADAVPGSELGKLQRERAKRARHMPVRKLLSEIPNILPKLKPCLLMSPLSVAQYLDAGGPPFDLVVFDEASQIPVWDAVGAIARGRQVIIAGDPRQLPPTNFFGRGETDEFPLDDGLFEDLESILDECLGSGLPSHHLTWHYRSRDEQLIAFSNKFYYENRLLTFPAPQHGQAAVRWVHVPRGHYDKGGTRTNRAEAEEVVREITRRLTCPALDTLSIGVVTFSQAQQDLIENLLDEQRRANPALEPFFSDDNPEPVFVKNLENVQGDERDVILFSVGYGPDAAGRTAMNFGPLNRGGGERRLNVAITRAKHQVVVFSTLRAEQIDLTRTRSLGVAHLKAYLEYAERGTRTLGETESAPARGEQDAFLLSVRGFLEAGGFEVHSQVGCSAYRINLAVVDPQNPLRYLAGVEGDGPTYHSAATARDRDRLRPQVMRQLGWNLIRVWSTDWHRNPESAGARLLASLRQATEAPRDAAPPPPPPEITLGSELPAAPPSPLRVYPLPLAHREKDASRFYDPATQSLLRERWLAHIHHEGPILEELLLKRLSEEWGFAKLGDRIRQTLLRARPEGCVHVGGGEKNVCWPASQTPFGYREFRVPDETEPGTLRPLESIPREEIANAMRHLLQQYASLPRDSLYRETLKLFGGKQLSARSQSLLEETLPLLAAEADISNESVTWLKSLPNTSAPGRDSFSTV